MTMMLMMKVSNQKRGVPRENSAAYLVMFLAINAITWDQHCEMTLVIINSDNLPPDDHTHHNVGDGDRQEDEEGEEHGRVGAVGGGARVGVRPGGVVAEHHHRPLASGPGHFHGEGD